jgi:hypothetical protein
MRNASPWLLVAVLAAAGCTDRAGRADGTHDDAVWSSSVTTLELELGYARSGVPPAGSVCEYGSALYRLSVTAMTLDSSVCVTEYPRPYTVLVRSRAVTIDELDQLDSVLSDLKLTTEEHCVTDAQATTLRVTKPTGTTAYADGTYQCSGGPLPFVDGLGDVHQALFDLANKP